MSLTGYRIPFAVCAAGGFIAMLFAAVWHWLDGQRYVF